MENNDDIRLHDLETLEARLRTEEARPREEGDVEPVSEFMVA